VVSLLSTSSVRGRGWGVDWVKIHILTEFNQLVSANRRKYQLTVGLMMVAGHGFPSQHEIDGVQICKGIEPLHGPVQPFTKLSEHVRS